MTPRTKLLYRPGRFVCRMFFRLFGGVQVFGKEHLPAFGAFLICANHTSLLDPPAVGVACPLPVAFLAKLELFRIPVFGWLIGALQSIPVDRSQLSKGTLAEIARMLEGGIPVLVFPEGTRSRTGQLGTGKAGLGLLARKMAVPLVPAYVHGTSLWPRTWRTERRMSVTFAAPIPVAWVTETAAQRSGYQEIADRIMREIQALRDRRVAALVPYSALAARAGLGENELYARMGKSR